MPQQSRRSTDRVLRVLLYLASRPQPVSAAAMAEACDIPRPTLYAMLKDMQRRQFVTHFPEERTWAIGVAAFEIGSAYLRSKPLQRLARPLLATLTAEVKETSHLAILQGNEVLYLLKQSPGRYATPLITDVGVRLPAHLTAVGKAILMHLPDSQLRALYPSSSTFVERTGRGSRRLFDLRAELDADRRRGYSVETNHTTEGITCIAAPVFDRAGLPAASIGISFATEEHAEQTWPSLAPSVCRAARILTARLQGT